MAGSPILKVYNAQGKYIASCKYLEDAAILVGFNGKGSKVLKGHNGKALWHEGFESQSASDSFDEAAQVMRDRWIKR